MSPSPQISVVMPVYNGERFLAAAIESILKQTRADFEFIIVDDGSSDETWAILRRYEATDSRIRLHRHQKNLGLTAALNQGFRLVRAPFVARMDADDISLPHRLETQLTHLVANPDVAVVGSFVERIDEHGLSKGLQVFPTQPALVAWSMLFFNSLAHPSVLIRSSAIDLTGPYSAEYPNIEDYELFMRLCQFRRLANIPEPLLLYRHWGGNVTRDEKHLYHSMRVVRDAVRTMNIDIEDEQAAAILGLSRNNYPREPVLIAALAGLIAKLRISYHDRVARDRNDRLLIDRDAATRLWLLSALAARQSPWLALTLATTAFKLRPTAILRFARKVLLNLAQRWKR